MTGPMLVPREESDGAQVVASNWSGPGGIMWRAGQPRPADGHPTGRVSGDVGLLIRPLPTSAGSADLHCDIRTQTAIFILAGVEFSGRWRVYPWSVGESGADSVFATRPIAARSAFRFDIGHP